MFQNYLKMYKGVYRPAFTRRNSNESASATAAGCAGGARRMSRPPHRSCHAASATNETLLLKSIIKYV